MISSLSVGFWLCDVFPASGHIGDELVFGRPFPLRIVVVEKISDRHLICSSDFYLTDIAIEIMELSLPLYYL